MSRNQGFTPSHEPLRHDQSLELQSEHTTGPFSFLNPTRAHYRHSDLPSARVSRSSTAPAEISEDGLDGREQLASGIHFKWRSRDNRKGRHTLMVDSTQDASSAQYLTPQSTSKLREVARCILRMGTDFRYWDVSWLVAVIFTLGSVVWVINAFFVWLPLVQPNTEFNNEILVGGGVTAFIGATIFEIGSILLMFEAVNENRSGCFGWALVKILEGDDEKGAKTKVVPDHENCGHHHTNKKNLVGKSNDGSDEGDKAWVWFPSVLELKTHYIRELGFLACSAQLFGATVFWISGFTALPGVNNKMSQGLLDGIYWTPQVVGGSGFIVSGLLFMLETQSTWYTPAISTLGWHIGLWNLIGAFGFTLCGALGPAYLNSGAEYEASLATFWGSWAFLIGSAIQWYESLDKFPVEDIGKPE